MPIDCAEWKRTVWLGYEPSFSGLACPHRRAVFGRRNKVLPALPAAQPLVIQPQVLRRTQDGIAVRTFNVSGCAHCFEVVFAAAGHTESIIIFPVMFSPMPLSRMAEPFTHPDWFFEIKWDGFRCLVFIENGRCRLVSRKGNEFKSFPALN